MAVRQKHTQSEGLPAFVIHGELAEVLNGMEGTNWNTNISKNHVKTVNVTFHVAQPRTTVYISAKGN